MAGPTSILGLFLSVLLHIVQAVPLDNQLSLPLKGVIDDVVKNLPAKMDQAELFEKPYLQFTASPEDATVMEGESVTLMCEATGIPPPTIQWMLDNRPIAQGRFERDDNTLDKLLNLGLVTIENGVTMSKLHLPCVGADQSGIYKCAASNGHEKIQTAARVQVDEGNEAKECSDVVKKDTAGTAPQIYMWTDGRFERDGASVQLFCRAKGEPEPVISWFFEEAKIENDEKHILLPNGDLLIRNVSWDETGDYACTAINENGQDKVEAFFYPTTPEELEAEVEVVERAAAGVF